MAGTKARRLGTRFVMREYQEVKVVEGGKGSG